MKNSIKSIKLFTVGVALGLSTFTIQAQGDQASIFSTTPFTKITTNVTNVDWKQATKGDTIISNFQEGAAIVKSGNKLGLINEEGYEICKPIYDDIHLFNHGYAAVKKHNKWTYINKQGHQLTPLRYDWVGGFTHNLSPVLKNGKWGVLNEQGFEKIPTKYDAVKIETDGKVWIKDKGKWEIFNNKPIGNDVAELSHKNEEHIF